MSNDPIGTPCPYCWIPLTGSDTIAVCDTCGKPHHVSCWRTNQGCTTRGCSGKIGRLIEPGSIAAPPQPRFRLVGDLPQLRIQPDAPVAVCGILLLEDTHANTLTAKCTFQSFTNRSLRALWVNISCRDQNGRLLPDAVTFRYQGLSAQRGSEFGGDIPVHLPDLRTRYVDIRIVKVLYTDGTEQTCSGMTRIYSEPKTLAETLGSEEQVKQFARRTTPYAHLMPMQTAECWLCTCGSINSAGEQDCPRCSCSLSALLQAADLKSHSVVPTPGPEPVPAPPTPKPAGRSKKKFVLIGAAAVLVLILALGILLGYPAYCYQQGQTALENRNFSTAHDYFVKAGSYKNSVEMATYVYYEEGCYYLTEGRYAEAIATFESISGYMNSDELCAEAYSRHAESLMADTDYEAAFLAIVQNPDQSQARENKLRCVEDWAAALLDPTNESVTAQDVESFLTLIGPEEYAGLLHSAVLDQMTAHPDYESYWAVYPQAAEAAGTLLSQLDGYGNSEALGRFFLSMHASYKDRESHFIQDMSLYSQMWSYDLIVDYVGQEGVTELFLLGYWTTANGKYYLEFEQKAEGKPGCHYTLPNVKPSSDTVDFTIIDGEFLWINAKGEETGRIFRFTVLGPDEVQVYCYGNRSTYILYRAAD